MIKLVMRHKLHVIITLTWVVSLKVLTGCGDRAAQAMRPCWR